MSKPLRRLASARLKPCHIVIWLTFIAAWSGNAANSQAQESSIVEGIARDALQRPLTDVKLHIKTPDGRVVGEAVSDNAGHYRIPGIAPGIYSVAGEKDGFDTSNVIVTVAAGTPASGDLTLASKQALDMNAVAQKLDAARNNIEPQIGASSYGFSTQTIENMPAGDNAPLIRFYSKRRASIRTTSPTARSMCETSISMFSIASMA